MKYLLSILFLMLPVAFASAQALDGFVNITEGIAEIVAILVPLVVSLSFIVFVWGIIQYLLAKDPESQSKAKGYIVWSVVAMAVIAGVWGISNFLLGNLGIDPNDSNNINIPNVR